MASNYPPPPTTAASDGSATSPQPPPVSPVPLPHHQYNGLASSASQSAAATAHHGLQALQAATAAAPPAPMSGPSPSTPQYPPLPSPGHPVDHQQYDTPRNGLPLVSEGSGTRQTRLRRACDMCSSRKVKCDEAGPPCRPCASLGVECTFSREMKRRGPPNKHAEAAKALKRPRLEPNMSPSPHGAAETLVSIAADGAPGPRVLDAESICPWDLLTHLVDDFFTYIHPLTPFPHEPTFRQAFLNRDDRNDPEFLALLSSMVGFLVASFPRTAQSHLKEQHTTHLYPRAITLIERCRLVALEARGPFFYSKEEISVNDAATSYFLALAAGYTFQFKLFRRFMAECMSFVQEMGHNRRRDAQQLSLLQQQYAPPPRPINHVEDQIGKRIFWVLVLAIRSMTQLGASSVELVLPPPTESDPYPDKPIEVDDQYIYPDQILGQPEGTTSVMAGFNKGIDVYMTMNTIASADIAYGITQLQWSEQKAILDSCLQSVKAVTEHMPPGLSMDLPSVAASAAGDAAASAPRTVPLPSNEYFDDLPGYQYYPPGNHAGIREDDLRLVLENQPERRRQIQLDIQKSNIYTSQLATRSYFVEMYMNLRDAARSKGARASFAATTNGPDGSGGGGSKSAAPEDAAASIAALAVQAAAAATVAGSDAVDAKMAAEREAVVQDLLFVLATIPVRNMEPNGSALINKVRQVASTLLNDAPERKGPVAQKADEDLAKFLNFLVRLERTAGGEGDEVAAAAVRAKVEGAGDDDDDALRNWADLREYQHRFAQSGGFLQ